MFSYTTDTGITELLSEDEDSGSDSDESNKEGSPSPGKLIVCLLTTINAAPCYVPV